MAKSANIHRTAVAFSLTTIAATMMSSVFNFYYVKTFLNVYRITDFWFNIAQVAYLIWNAINDPLFGYFQDTSTIACMRKRRLNIMYGAPAFALSFLMVWFPWGHGGVQPDWVVGLHLTCALCFYDGMFTFVVLAQCSLFAEISTDTTERHIVLKYSQLASIIGSSAIFASQIFANQEEAFWKFQVFTVIVSVLACILLYNSGKYVEVDEDNFNKAYTDNSSSSPASSLPLFTLLRQILSQKNFVCFVVMNFFQVFHTTFSSNFFLIFATQLIGPDVLPSIVRSVLAGSAYMLPQIIVLVCGPVIAGAGSYNCIMWSFYLKFGLAVLVYMAGPTYIWLLAFFFIIDKCLPDAVFSLFNLSVSDIIDDDLRKHARKSPISSMIFGTNALFTKPAQSIAPMIVVYILSQHGYNKESTSSTSSGSNVNSELHDVMFRLLCLIPAVVAVCQMFIWRFYTLRHAHQKDKAETAILESSLS